MNYSHLVEVLRSERRIRINRVYADGRIELFTETDLPNETGNEDPAKYHEFCRILGENILLDSPVARDLLSI
jgi:hypothetical protein